MASLDHLVQQVLLVQLGHQVFLDLQASLVLLVLQVLLVHLENLPLRQYK